MTDNKAKVTSWLIPAVGFIIAIATALIPEDVNPNQVTYIPNTVQAASATPQYIFSDKVLDSNKYSYVVAYANIDGGKSYIYFTPKEDTWTSRNVINTRYDGNFYTNFNIGSDDTITFADGTCIIKVDDYFIITTDFTLERLK